MRDLLNKKIVLVGAGGHCKSVADTLKKTEDYNEIIITDPDVPAGSFLLGCRIVGDDSNLTNAYMSGFEDAFITVGSIGNTSTRRRLHKVLQGIGFNFPSVIDTSAVIAEDAVIADGVFVGKTAVINSGSKIGEFAIVNSGAIIEHDCSIGKFTHISVGAVICGGCSIGDDVFIGANSTVVQGISIGSNSVIGAAGTVLADVPENTTVLGTWRG